jgi:hypothetical protein
MFVLKITNENIWEYNQGVQYWLIGFQKAYDFVYTETMEMYGRI